MVRSVMIAALLAIPALPALAQTPVPAGHGATAGRSPHQAYRQAGATPACAKQMHTVPAGKLPTYGANAHAAQPCGDARVEVAEANGGQRARD